VHGRTALFAVGDEFKVLAPGKYLLVLNASISGRTGPFLTPTALSVRVQTIGDQILMGANHPMICDSDVVTTTGLVGLDPSLMYKLNVAVTGYTGTPISVNILMYAAEV
jgi:hypothetical protein